MELSSKIPAPFSSIQSDTRKYLEENRTYFEMYRVRAWIWSIFVPFIQFVPTYLLIVAFDQFNFTSIVQFLLGIFLFVIWMVIPGMFLHVNKDRNTYSRVWYWSWFVLNLGFVVFWIVLLT
ncbi:hypothetical protein [Pseudalkalibacillus salsuginis]|uniref:hypothetical protein n=1 Tax=Pseudalkalibacillus salsuginis TaxID=2910972 RepID=UPI001F406FAA|nr:hypothetical protein [Pseudalkalibacillus salsuginis]MCF6408918.1 hypothetical protein [Pseudalkalibacillus salsuginis]